MTVAGMLYYPPPEHTTDTSTFREPRKPGRPRKSDGNDSDMQMRQSQVCCCYKVVAFSLAVCLSFCPPACLSVCPSACLSVCLSASLAVSLCLSVCLCLSVFFLSVCLLCLPTCLSVCLCVCLPFCPSVASFVLPCSSAPCWLLAREMSLRLHP